MTTSDASAPQQQLQEQQHGSSRFAESAEETFAAASKELQQHQHDKTKVGEIEAKLMDLLSTPEAAAAIANGTNNCGQSVLENMIPSSMGWCRRWGPSCDAPRNQSNAICTIVKKALALDDASKKINVTASAAHTSTASPPWRSRNEASQTPADVADDDDDDDDSKACRKFVRRIQLRWKYLLYV